VVRIDKASELTKIQRFNVYNSEFSYGQAIKIESSKLLEVVDCEYRDITLSNSDLLSFNSVSVATIARLKFINILKNSDKSRYAILMPSLILSKDVSDYDLSDLSFLGSSASFISIQ
jgi:hypothetical protein